MLTFSLRRVSHLRIYVERKRATDTNNDEIRAPLAGDVDSNWIRQNAEFVRNSIRNSFGDDEE